MIFAVGFILALLGWIGYRISKGSVSGAIACAGILLMLVSVLIFVGKYLP